MVLFIGAVLRMKQLRVTYDCDGYKVWSPPARICGHVILSYHPSFAFKNCFLCKPGSREPSTAKPRQAQAYEKVLVLNISGASERQSRECHRTPTSRRYPSLYPIERLPSETKIASPFTRPPVQWAVSLLSTVSTEHSS